MTIKTQSILFQKALLFSLFSFLFSCQDFQPIYQLKDKNCTIQGGPLTLFSCPASIEIHRFQSLVKSGSSNSYSNYYRKNTNATTQAMGLGTYQNINQIQKALFTSNFTLYSASINSQTNTIKTLSNETYSFANNLTSGLQFDDIGIYLGNSQTALYFRDLIRNTTFSTVIRINNRPLNFKVSRKGNMGSNQYDLLVCSFVATSADTCQIHLITTNKEGSSPTVEIKNTIRISKHCAYSLVFTSSYIAIGCPFYSKDMGRITIYTRNDDYSQEVLLIETGNSMKTVDYYYIGGDMMDYFEHNANHTTLFYSSINQKDGIEYSFINTVQLLKFFENGSNVYKYLITTNQYRQKTQDNLIKGRILFSYYQNSLLALYQNLSTVYQMAVCTHNQSQTINTCYQCGQNQFSSSFNGKFCEDCQNTYSIDSYQSLMQLLYCNQGQSFSSSNYKFQSTRFANSFIQGTNNNDPAPQNTQEDDFKPYQQDDNNNNNDNNNGDNDNNTDNNNGNTDNGNDNTNGGGGTSDCDLACQKNLEQNQSNEQGLTQQNKIIIIVVCVVIGLIIIVIPIVAVICVKRKKARKLKEQRESDYKEEDQKSDKKKENSLKTEIQLVNQPFDKILKEKIHNDDQHNSQPLIQSSSRHSYPSPTEENEEDGVDDVESVESERSHKEKAKNINVKLDQEDLGKYRRQKLNDQVQPKD